MALLFATKSGLWTDPTVWNTNTVPTTADIVYADGRTVLINSVSASANIITTSQRPGGSPGGRFHINNGVSLSANILSGSTAVLVFNSAAPSFFNLFGNISGGDFPQLTNFDGTLVNFRGGNINIIGDIKKTNITSVGSNLQPIILHNNGGIIYLNGNIDLTEVIGRAINVTTNSTMHCFKPLLFTPSLSAISLPAAVNVITNTGTLYLTSDINTDVTPVNNSLFIISNSNNFYLSGTVFETLNQFIRAIFTQRPVAGQPGGYTFIRGDIYGNTGGNTGNSSVYVSNGFLEVVGNVYGANFGGGSNAVYADGTSFINITGFVVGGNFGVSNAARGITLEGSTFLNLNGFAYGNGNFAIVNGNSETSTCTAVLIRAVGGRGGGINPMDGTSPAIVTLRDSMAFIDELEYGEQGATPATGQVYFTNKPRSVIIMRGVGPSYEPTTFIGSISADNLFPPSSSVRFGLLYGNNNRIGTLVVPPASEVSFGVPLDNNRLGTYVVGADKFWTVSSRASAFLTKYTVGYRVKNLLVTSQAGKLLTTFNLSGYTGEY